MFKYLLFRGLEVTFKIFTESKTPLPCDVQPLLESINIQTRAIWDNLDILPAIPEVKCKELSSPLFDLDDPKDESLLQTMTPEILEVVDKIFSKHYGNKESMLLIGRTDNQAYQVQHQYASEVAKLLGHISSEHKSRAMIYLGPVFGRSSMPLLCPSSIRWLWRLCRSSYYTKQISLVSQTQLITKLPSTDSRCSSTGGWSLLLMYRRPTPWAVATSRPSTAS